MSSKLPVISGADLIRALGKFGYEAVRQRAVTSVFVILPTLAASPSRFPFMLKLPLALFAAFSATPRSLSKNSSQYSNFHWTKRTKN